jgi:hypothetical protein
MSDTNDTNESFKINIGPSPEYCAAARYVLGGDDPATVLGAIINRDPRQARVGSIHAAIVYLNEGRPPSGLRRFDPTLKSRDAKVAVQLAAALKASA